MSVRNLEEFNNKHTGKPAFILGAGPSLNFQNPELLKNEITFAVNSAHMWLPSVTYFVSDDWAVMPWNFFHLNLRNSETTVLLYENKLKKAVPWFGDRSVLFRHRKGHNITDIYEHYNKINHIGESRTSIGTSIMIAHIMGCSPVLLLGVDGCRLYGYRYFWQFDGWQKPKRNDGVPIDRYKKIKIGGGIHGDQDDDLIEINEYWDKFGHKINKKVEVYNCSKLSSLKVFPKIDLEEFLINGDQQ